MPEISAGQAFALVAFLVCTAIGAWILLKANPGLARKVKLFLDQPIVPAPRDRDPDASISSGLPWVARLPKDRDPDG